MPHIALPDGLPGITSGFAFRPETARPMTELAEILLRGPSTLTSCEREMIATYVSGLNECYFCRTSHRAAIPRPFCACSLRDQDLYNQMGKRMATEGYRRDAAPVVG